VNVLVIGGTGFISTRLVRILLERGDHVSLFTRGRHRWQEHAWAMPELLVGDRTVPSDLARSAHGRTFDAVFDMIAYRQEESEAAARIFRGKVGRFIHCSTVSVYMVAHDVQCPVTEDQDRRPLMKSGDRNPFGMGYGIAKRGCEEALWRAHDERLFPVSMLRPTFVSGPGDPAGRDFFWIERILDGSPLLVPGPGEFEFQQVYVEDVARMFAAITERSTSVGKAYNVAGDEIFTLNGYLRALGDLLGRTPELLHVDQDSFDGQPFSSSTEGDVFPFNTRRPAVFGLERIRKDLGYRSTPFREWMAGTILWWKTRRMHSIGYERRHEELAFLRTMKVTAT